ncbi:4'-phosphopantetheinyl transferase superfamily protein [Virgibacillus massiliensis]|nr:4'-phosphopantetheinyl transferase superfamily protein [Virgibacillus massiliensis]
MGLVNLYVCKLPSKRSYQEIQRLLPNISARVTQKISRYRFLDDAYRTLIGDLLLHRFFYLNTGYDLRKQRIEITNYGKPNIPTFPSFHYNISHSGDWVALATHHYPVGVDIEKVQPLESIVVKNLLSHREYKNMLKHDRPVQAFYEIWTGKESFVKATGKGLSIPLQSFSVTGMRNIQLINTTTEDIVKGYLCERYKDLSRYSLTVCAKQADKKSFNDLTECQFSWLANEL